MATNNGKEKGSVNANHKDSFHPEKMEISLGYSGLKSIPEFLSYSRRIGYSARQNSHVFDLTRDDAASLSCNLGYAAQQMLDAIQALGEVQYRVTLDTDNPCDPLTLGHIGNVLTLLSSLGETFLYRAECLDEYIDSCDKAKVDFITLDQEEVDHV